MGKRLPFADCGFGKCDGGGGCLDKREPAGRAANTGVADGRLALPSHIPILCSWCYTTVIRDGSQGESGVERDASLTLGRPDSASDARNLTAEAVQRFPQCDGGTVRPSFRRASAKASLLGGIRIRLGWLLWALQRNPHTGTVDSEGDRQHQRIRYSNHKANIHHCHAIATKMSHNCNKNVKFFRAPLKIASFDNISGCRLVA